MHLHGNLPVVLYVLVYHASNHHGNDCIVPRGNKHERQADHHSQKRQCPEHTPELVSGHFWKCVIECVSIPVVIGESWSPIWCPQERLKSTGQVYKEITHEEKPRRRKSNLISDSNRLYYQT